MKKLYLEFIAKLEMSLLGGSAFLRQWQSWAAFIGGWVGGRGLLGGGLNRIGRRDALSLLIPGGL